MMTLRSVGGGGGGGPRFRRNRTNARARLRNMPIATRPIAKTSPTDFPSMPTAETQLIARPRSLVSVFLSAAAVSLPLPDTAHHWYAGSHAGPARPGPFPSLGSLDPLTP